MLHRPPAAPCSLPAAQQPRPQGAAAREEPHHEPPVRPLWESGLSHRESQLPGQGAAAEGREGEGGRAGRGRSGGEVGGRWPAPHRGLPLFGPAAAHQRRAGGGRRVTVLTQGSPRAAPRPQWSPGGGTGLGEGGEPSAAAARDASRGQKLTAQPVLWAGGAFPECRLWQPLTQRCLGGAEGSAPGCGSSVPTPGPAVSASQIDSAPGCGTTPRHRPREGMAVGATGGKHRLMN